MLNAAFLFYRAYSIRGACKSNFGRHIAGWNPLLKVKFILKISSHLHQICLTEVKMLTILAVMARACSIMSHHGPRPLVVCGPSGSGKSTLLKKLLAEFPDTFGFSVSHTTRQPRPGEHNGVHYHFVTREEMLAAIDRGEFLETATFSGNLYGTSKQSVYNVQAEGKVCVLDIEIQGVEQIKKTDLNPILIFILPPSLTELERRLRGRKTETEESLQKRLETAKIEIEYGSKPGNFHIIIENEHIKDAYSKLRDFLLTELETQKSEGINVILRRVSNADK